MKGLTTHVLDTLAGVPAVGVKVAFFDMDKCLKMIVTDENGRGKLADILHVGTYEIRFYIGAYFAKRNLHLPKPSFLDEITVRFSVADAERHYHIPLVATPWSYTTYKGGAPKSAPAPESEAAELLVNKAITAGDNI